MKISFSHRNSGYTIVEAMVAVSILLMAVAAAASLSMTMANQEELNARGARAVNWHENAVRLYQMGIGDPDDPAAIVALMPGLPQVTSLTASTASETFSALPAGNNAVDVTTLTLTYKSNVEGTVSRSNSMKAVRY